MSRFNRNESVYQHHPNDYAEKNEESEDENEGICKPILFDSVETNWHAYSEESGS
jgi:hypothetical protein